MNESIDKIMEKHPQLFRPKMPTPILTVPASKVPEEVLSELRLYYVCASRCRHKLDNAKHLPQKESSDDQTT